LSRRHENRRTGSADSADSPRLRRTRGLAVGIGLVALCVALTARCRRGSHDGSGAGELATALGCARPVEGRLVGLPWAPYAGAAVVGIGRERLRPTVLRVGRALANGRTAENLRNEAILALALGRIDVAIAELREALDRQPASAPLLADLAAARLARARTQGEPFELILALDAATRAVRLDSGLLAAQYNRTLALERLYLRTEARRGWELYLARERDPGWAREARSHLGGLVDPPPAAGRRLVQAGLERAVTDDDHAAVQLLAVRFAQPLRELIEEEVLASWAAAQEASRQIDADRLLAMARMAGAALEMASGEHMIADSVRQIDRARARPAAHRQLRRLVHGHKEYHLGITMSRRGDFTRALGPLLAAKRSLSEAGSSFALWAEFELALCHYQHSHYTRVLEWGKEALRDRRCDRYPALCGRTQRLVGLVSAIQGNPVGSLTAYVSARAAFRRLRESGNAAGLGAAIASDFDYLGQTTAAWRSLYEGLGESALAGSALARYSAFEEAAWLAEAQGVTEVALLFQDEVVRAAEETAAPYVISEALRRRAAILGSLGRSSEAVAVLQQARRRLDQVPDARARRTVEGDILFTEGALVRRTSPAQATSLLTAAARSYRETAYHYQLSRALLQTALAYLTLRDDDRAEHSLGAAITEVERQREKVSTPEGRAAYLHHERDVFDEMISFQFTRRHAAKALGYSERAHARVLLDWILALPSGEANRRSLIQAVRPSITFKHLWHQMPPRLILIEFAALPHCLIAWIHQRECLHAERLDVSADALAALVGRLLRSLRARQTEDILAVSSTLYSILIEPLRRHLPAGSDLALVPDGPLHDLPFALLRDGRTGRYLVQEHSLVVAPSAAILASCLRRAKELTEERSTRALLIGDPSFDRALYPHLSRLPSAGDEALSLVAMYPGSQALLAEGASKEAFLGMAGRFQLVHFAGHAVVNPEYPLLSQLLFAAVPGDPARGVLFSWEILGRRMRHTKLVVLAGCDTAVGQFSRGEGIEGLAGPILAAGVPGVIGSLGPVDDRMANAFFLRFYRHMRAGGGPAAALQAAQIECLEPLASCGDPFSWAMFELVGAGT